MRPVGAGICPRARYARTVAGVTPTSAATASTPRRLCGWSSGAAIATTVVQGLNPPAAGRGAALTNRELAVLHLLARGLLNKEIADQLNIGEETVKTHVGNILAKLGVSHRT